MCMCIAKGITGASSLVFTYGCSKKIPDNSDLKLCFFPFPNNKLLHLKYPGPISTWEKGD